MKTTFIISHIPNPRMNKRLGVSKKINETSLIYWNRKTVNIWEHYHKDVETHEISIKAHYTSPIKRVIPTLKFISKAYKILKIIQPNQIYVANLDMLIIANLYKTYVNSEVRVIYEVADLNSIVIDKPKNSFNLLLQKTIITMEKFLCKNIAHLIITSEMFYEVYYSKFVEQNKMTFMPNIPTLKYFSDYRQKDEGKFTIGFIGAIRYKKQMKLLIDLSDKLDINVLFAGSGLDDEIEKLTLGKENIVYYGRYSYESEISKLYSKIDCVYCVYDASLKNVQIALPNKLYEAIYCELPIIVARETYLAEIVEKLGIGYSINHNSISDLETIVEKIMKDDTEMKNIRNRHKNSKHIINNEFYEKKLEIILQSGM